MGDIRVPRNDDDPEMRWTSHRIVLCAAAAVIGVTGVAVVAAFAASLGVTSQRVTSWSAASTVPISTCTLTPSADEYVAQDDSSNFGSVSPLHVQSYQTTVVIITTQRNRRSFVKFDLSSCSIPANAEVKSATLSVFLSSAPNQNRTWNIGRVTAAWTEGSINWPGPATTSSTSVSTGTTDNVTLQANVTANVAAFVSGSEANNGWRFSDSAENSSTQRNGQFTSRESGTASQRPTLVVNYYP